MQMLKLRLVLASAAVFGCVSVGTADVLNCTPSPHSHADGYCGYAHSTQPESHVRSAASLNKDDGRITFKFQLETDSAASGPKGTMSVVLRDSAGADLVRYTVGPVSRGGKTCGKAVKCGRLNAQGEDLIPIDIARRAASIHVTSHHHGGSGLPLGVTDGDLDAARRIVKEIVAAGSNQ